MLTKIQIIDGSRDEHCCRGTHKTIEYKSTFIPRCCSSPFILSLIIFICLIISPFIIFIIFINLLPIHWNFILSEYCTTFTRTTKWRWSVATRKEKEKRKTKEKELIFHSIPFPSFIINYSSFPPLDNHHNKQIIKEIYFRNKML